MSYYAHVGRSVTPSYGLGALMRRPLFFVCAALLLVLGWRMPGQSHPTPGVAQPTDAAYRSIRDFGVLPSNSAEVNRANLQKAIDWAAPRGAALFVEPSDVPYPIAG